MEDFQIERDRVGFEIETDCLLFVPRKKPPPSGWPLLVCLHGMGMSAERFATLLGELRAPGAAYLFPQGVYPHEVRRKDSIRIGYAWYLYDGNEEPFRSTSIASERHLLGLIDRVARERPIDSARVFLLGFSQGAYLGYFVGIRNARRFAGLVGIGGRVREEMVRAELGGARDLPILMIQGERDESVPTRRVRETFEMLEKAGLQVELRAFAVGHEIQSEQLASIREWLAPRLARGRGA